MRVDSPPTPEPIRVESGERRKPKADVALVVVHGMGRQQQGDTLLEWAEPILGRIDWLAKHARGAHLDSVSVEEDALGVTIIDSVLSGAPTPHVLVKARWRTSDTVIRERRIAIVEARWSESFVPMTRRDVFNWGVKFLWRSLIRMFAQFARTMVEIPVVALRGGTGASVGGVLLAIPAFLVGLALTIVSAVVMAVLGVLLTLLLPLLSPLMLIPLVKKLVQKMVDVLVDFVGDVGTYRQRPLRAAAMRVVLHDALAHAATMIEKQGGELAVLAHSQGAAISAAALFHELDLSELPVRRLSTVGAAITLLGKTMWDAAPQRETYKPVTNWVRNAPGIRWDNYWAIWDPFAAGPIGDSRRARRSRWERCYREGATTQAAAGGSAYFPAEHAVHNTSLPFTDHQSYARNTVQVIEPIALELLGPEFVNESTGTTAERDKRVVGIRRARGIMLVASIIIAALLPTQAWFTASIGAIIDWAKGVVLWVLRALQWDPGLDLGPFYSSVDGRFTPVGLVLLVALVAAGLIWFSGFIAGHAERHIVWDREAASGLYTYFLPELLFQGAMLGAAAGLVSVVASALWPGILVPILASLAVVLTLLSVHLGAVPIAAPASNPPVASQ
ncbi:MAG TPA: hypothetical protein VFT01_06450 [Homoserinimonas sp.]|nr:hypothetical protein [Homoserinimonas sp.]